MSRRSTPIKSSVRFYYIDFFILALILQNNHYGYSKDLAERTGRSKRTITRHLKKLSQLGIIERHGSVFCSMTWYSIPEYNIPPVLDLLSIIEELFSLKIRKPNSYIVLKLLPVPVPSGHLKISAGPSSVTVCTLHRTYRDPSRPGGNSTPYVTKQLSLALYSLSPRTLQTRLGGVLQNRLRDYG